MPPKGSKKGRGGAGAARGRGRGKGKAKAKEVTEEVVEVEAVQDVNEGVPEVVEKMTGARNAPVQEQGRPTNDVEMKTEEGDDKVKVKSVAEDTVEAVKDVAEGSSAFVQKMTDTQDPKAPSRVSPQVQDSEMVDVEESRKGGNESREVETSTPTPEPTAENDNATPEEASSSSLTIEERQKKLQELRARMRDSARQNRTELINESTKQKVTARESSRREKQLKLAEMLRLKNDAVERGEDVERNKNWEYTIEENEEWERKKRRKERNADFEFHDEEQQARRRYKKDLVHLKPDLESYNKQKQLALGTGPGASSSGSGNALTAFNPQGGTISTYEQQQAAESLYRDANTLLYADNKPSEEAIDRVISKLNQEQDKRNKFSRKRLNEDEGDITYINERNRVFNKKIGRYYDKYTAEIRASFERGTAL